MFTNLALAALGAIAGSAGAATITENINYSVADFVNLLDNGIASPFPGMSGKITVTYDPTKTYEDDTADLVVHSLTGPTSDSPLGFSYAKGELYFGGIANDAENAGFSSNDVLVEFGVTDPSAPTLITCATLENFCGVEGGKSGVYVAGYTQVGTPLRAWFATSGSVDGSSSVTSVPIVPSVPSVPEPANVALLGLGLAAVGVARRLRRG